MAASQLKRLNGAFGTAVQVAIDKTVTKLQAPGMLNP